MHKTKQDRQAEAIERDLQRASRTTDEQLAHIHQRPGKSDKEMARLLIGSPSQADMTNALVSPNDDLFVDYDVECSASDDGYHIWMSVAEDMYECRACGAIDC